MDLSDNMSLNGIVMFTPWLPYVLCFLSKTVTSFYLYSNFSLVDVKEYHYTV